MLLSWEYGTDIFVGVFWLKLITMALTIYHINTNRGAWFYYYHNLGISRRLLWTATMGFDFSLYLILIILVNHFR